MRGDVVDTWSVDLPRSRRARVELRRARRWGQRTKGWYDPQLKLIVVYVHPWWSAVSAEVTLIHELAHASGAPGCAGHRLGFRRELVRAAGRHGVDLGRPVPATRRLRTVRALEDVLWWRILAQRFQRWLGLVA